MIKFNMSTMFPDLLEFFTPIIMPNYTFECIYIPPPRPRVPSLTSLCAKKINRTTAFNYRNEPKLHHYLKVVITDAQCAIKGACTRAILGLDGHRAWQYLPVDIWQHIYDANINENAKVAVHVANMFSVSTAAIYPKVEFFEPQQFNTFETGTIYHPRYFIHRQQQLPPYHRHIKYAKRTTKRGCNRQLYGAINQ